MANKIVQRLVAAGATPERAEQFAQDFARRQREKTTSKPTRGDKFAKPVRGTSKRLVVPMSGETDEDAFDKELAAISAATFPDAFQVPRPDDPKLDDYIIGVYGQEAYDRMIDSIYGDVAPNLYAARNSSGYERKIAKAVELGWSLTDIQREIQRDYTAGKPDLLNLPVLDLGEDYLSSANNLAKTYFDEYRAAKDKIATGKEKWLTNQDEYYGKYLPHPNLRYGRDTNLKAGTISYKSVLPELPEATIKSLNFVPAENVQNLSPSTVFGSRVRGEAAGQNIRAEDRVIEGLNANNYTPYSNELDRRKFVNRGLKR